MAATEPNEKVQFTIVRAAKKQEVSVQLQARTVATPVRRSPANTKKRITDATGPAAVAGPTPNKPKHFCTVKLVREDADLYSVTTTICLGQPIEASDDFVGSADEIVEHYKNASPFIRNNINVCFAALQHSRVKPTVRVIPRNEGPNRYVRFLSLRKNAAGQPIAYVYDKRVLAQRMTAPLAGIADDKGVTDELKQLPNPVRKRIDQTIRSLKDFASPGRKTP